MSLEIYPILCNAGFMDNYAYVLIDSETDDNEKHPVIELDFAKNKILYRHIF